MFILNVEEGKVKVSTKGFIKLVEGAEDTYKAEYVENDDVKGFIEINLHLNKANLITTVEVIDSLNAEEYTKKLQTDLYNYFSDKVINAHACIC